MTDKLTAAMWDELAEAHAEAGHEYDRITRACRRRGDEAARREAVDNPLDCGHATTIISICEQIGYGRVMQMASESWRKKDPIGALSIGPCFGLLKKTDAPPPPADDRRALLKRCVLVLAASALPVSAAKVLDEAISQIRNDGKQAAAIEALRAERDAIVSLIPPQFLDPPDGGEVKPVELVRRVVAREKALEEELRQTLSDIREKRSAANYRGFMKETDGRICKALAAGGANG